MNKCTRSAWRPGRVWPCQTTGQTLGNVGVLARESDVVRSVCAEESLDLTSDKTETGQALGTRRLSRDRATDLVHDIVTVIFHVHVVVVVISDLVDREPLSLHNRLVRPLDHLLLLTLLLLGSERRGGRSRLGRRQGLDGRTPAGRARSEQRLARLGLERNVWLADRRPVDDLEPDRRRESKARQHAPCRGRDRDDGPSSPGGGRTADRVRRQPC